MTQREWEDMVLDEIRNEQGGVLIMIPLCDLGEHATNQDLIDHIRMNADEVWDEIGMVIRECTEDFVNAPNEF